MHRADVNQGVSCEVVSCSYYEPGNKCSADTIHVGNPSASCCTDTRCDTFEDKKYGNK